MSIEDDVKRFVELALMDYGRIDILVNNAARFVFNTATEVTEKGELWAPRQLTRLTFPIWDPPRRPFLNCLPGAPDWDCVLNTNVKGYSFAIKHAGKAMGARKSGAIVNIASTSAFVAQPGFVPYSTSKAAVVQLGRCCALDLAQHGIR